MLDEKYVVFKREEFDKWWATTAFSEESMALGIQPLGDAVVIRKQDIFAGPALHAYSSSINTALEIIDTLRIDLSVGVEVRSNLEEIRDYFFQQALEADDVRVKKVPD